LIVIGLVERVTGPVIVTPVTVPVVIVFANTMLPVEVAARELRGVLPPTIPAKVIVPLPADKVSACAPSIVVVAEEKLIGPFAVMIVIGLVARVTGPAITTPPTSVVMLLFREMLPGDVAVAESEVGGVPPPTIPVKVIVPEPAVSARLDAPLIVPPKEMLPPAALVSTVVVAAATVVLIPAAIETEAAMTLEAEAPNETPLGAAVTESALRANVFPIVFAKLTEPVAVKVSEWALVREFTVLPKLKSEPEMVIVAPLRFTGPLKVAGPVVVMLPPSLVSPPEETVRLVRGVVAPTVVNKTVPVVAPPVRVRLCAPLKGMPVDVIVPFVAVADMVMS
jgi:hypothetical protein